MQEIKTVENSDQIEFEIEINELLHKGFEISSTSCGFVNDKRYDYCSCWQAILTRGEE